jgi:hypothetical protein
MIKLHSTTGFVTIDDRKGLQSISPQAGMEFSTVGADLIIVTGDDGIAELDINKHYVLMEGNSYLHIRADGRSFLNKFKEKLFGKNDAKLICGKVWARIESMVGKEQGKEILEGNAVVGVRG